MVRRIAFLSVISIFLSVTSFLVVLFVMNGMSGSIAKRIMLLEPHLNIEIAGVQESRLIMSQPVVQRLQEDSHNRLHLFENQDLIVRSYDGQFRGAMARGVTTESFRYFLSELKQMNSKNKNSEFVDNIELPEANEVLLGVDLARSLGVFEGDSLTLVSPEALLLPAGESPRMEKVTVKAIISTNIPDLDAQALYYRLDSPISRLSEAVRRGVEVWLPKAQDADQKKLELASFDGVKIETWGERNKSIFFALKMERFTIGLFLSLAGLIAGSGVLTVLFLLISQKKRDIAILKTVGMSGRAAVRLFAGIGFTLSMLGVVLGVLVGTGLSLYIQANPLKILPDIYYDNEIPAKVDFWLVLLVLFVGALMSWAGSWIPALIARAIRPAEALRIKN